MDWVTKSFVATANKNQVVILDELIVGLREGIAPVDFFESVRGLTGDIEYRPLLGTPDQFVVTLTGKSGKETLEIANAWQRTVEYGTPLLIPIRMSNGFSSRTIPCILINGI